MPRISQLSTETANSTSDVILNVGSTTRRLEVQQLLGAQFTAQGQVPFAAGADASTFLASPTSGAVLIYSSGSSAPAWSIPTSGAVLIASSGGVPTWRALGTSGQVLQSSGGSPAWVNSTAILRETLTGSGDLLVTSSAGNVQRLALGTSGQVLESTGGVPTWQTQVTGGGTTSAWILSIDSSQAMAAAAHVNILWTSEVVDTDNFHTTATSAAEVVIRVAGTYLIGASVLLPGASTAILRIMEGGSTIVTAVTQGSDAIQIALNLSVIRNFATSGSTITVTALSGTTNQIDKSTVDYGRTLFWGHSLS